MQPSKYMSGEKPVLTQDEGGNFDAMGVSILGPLWGSQVGG